MVALPPSYLPVAPSWPILTEKDPANLLPPRVVILNVPGSVSLQSPPLLRFMPRILIKPMLERIYRSNPCQG